MIIKIKKRDGREVPFNIEKIADAIFKAAQAVGGQNYDTSFKLAEKVTNIVEENHKNAIPTVEDIQDTVERVLIDQGHAKTAKEYILYRADRSRVRDMNTRLMKVFEDITFQNKDEESRMTSRDRIFKYGMESTKEFYDLFVLNTDHSKAHKRGDIFIHDLEYLMLSINSCFLNLEEVLDSSITIGKINIDKPYGIDEYMENIFSIVSLVQKDLHGEIGISNFDYLFDKAIKNTFKSEYRENLKRSFQLTLNRIGLEENIDNIFEILEEEYNLFPEIVNGKYLIEEETYLKELVLDEELINKIQIFANEVALNEVNKLVYSSLFKFINRINTLNCKDLSNNNILSINIGTNISVESRILINNLLEVIKIQIKNNRYFKLPKIIFKVKNGINLNVNDKNNDLLKRYIDLGNLGLDLNISFLDSSYNKSIEEIGYLSENMRIFENLYDDKKSTVGRGNLSYTSINLPRIGIKNKGNILDFYKELDEKIDLVITQLLERFEMQAGKIKSDFPILMGEGLWIESNKLRNEESIREVLKQGNLGVGFVGLSQCLKVLIGSNQGETKKAQKLGLEIINHMKNRLDDINEQYKMNFNLMVIEDTDHICKRFIELDRSLFGEIEGVTNLEVYSNGFYIPDNIKLDLFEKIKIEGEYHKYSNGGHKLKLNTKEIPINSLYRNLEIIKDLDIGYLNLTINND